MNYYYLFLYYYSAQNFVIVKQYFTVLGACKCKTMSLYSN